MRELTRFEYFGTRQLPPEKAKAASMFRRESDYAFFAARLGWTPDQYGSLTPVELSFVRKEFETMTVRDSEIMQHAVEVAVANVLRKKGRKLLELWKKLNPEHSAPPVKKDEFDALKAAFAKKYGKRRPTTTE